MKTGTLVLGLTVWAILAPRVSAQRERVFDSVRTTPVARERYDPRRDPSAWRDRPRGQITRQWGGNHDYRIEFRDSRRKGDVLRLTVCPYGPYACGLEEVMKWLKTAGPLRVTENGTDVILSPAADRVPGLAAPPGWQYQRTGPRGAVIHYFIDGLGSRKLSAWRGTRTHGIDLSNDMQGRSDGQRRPFRPDENSFDPGTGLQWNWVGSSRGGGASILPGGIGNVNIKCVNEFDRSAKHHDIQYWLWANFEVGADVTLKINGRWRQYTVRSASDVHREGMDDFYRAGQRTLDAALRHARGRHQYYATRRPNRGTPVDRFLSVPNEQQRRAKVVGYQRDIDAIRTLQLRYSMGWFLLEWPQVVTQVLDDDMFRAVLDVYGMPMWPSWSPAELNRLASLVARTKGEGAVYLARDVLRRPDPTGGTYYRLLSTRKDVEIAAALRRSPVEVRWMRSEPNKPPPPPEYRRVRR